MLREGARLVIDALVALADQAPGATTEAERSEPMTRSSPGALPTFHGFRHTAASEAIAAGDGAEEVSWQLGHKNSNVTRAVYVQEIKNAGRRARRRPKMKARYGDLLTRAHTNGDDHSGGALVRLADRRAS